MAKIGKPPAAAQRGVEARRAATKSEDAILRSMEHATDGDLRSSKNAQREADHYEDLADRKKNAARMLGAGRGKGSTSISRAAAHLREQHRNR